jgi:hypothetical protein
MKHEIAQPGDGVLGGQVHNKRSRALCRTGSVFLAVIPLNACCDDSNRYMQLIPWGDGTAVPPIAVSVGDSFAFSAYVTGTPKGSGFFADCRLMTRRHAQSASSSL